MTVISCATQRWLPAAHGHSTLGVAVEPRRCIADQLLLKVAVIPAMHDRVQLCHDPETDLVLTHVKDWESAGSITSSGCMDTRFWAKNQQPKPSMKWVGIDRKTLSSIHTRDCAASHAQCRPVRYWV